MSVGSLLVISSQCCADSLQLNQNYKTTKKCLFEYILDFAQMKKVSKIIRHTEQNVQQATKKDIYFFLLPGCTWSTICFGIIICAHLLYYGIAAALIFPPAGVLSHISHPSILFFPLCFISRSVCLKYIREHQWTHSPCLSTSL